MDIWGKLAKLQHRARHEIANFLGPDVLLTSAIHAGVIDEETYEGVREELFGKFTQSELAEEYASLLEMIPGQIPACASETESNLPDAALDLGKHDIRILVLDDDHAAGWPEVIACVMNAVPVTPSRSDIPVQSYEKNHLKMDCWVGDDLDQLFAVLLPDKGRHIQKFPYDAIFLDMRASSRISRCGVRGLVRV